MSFDKLAGGILALRDDYEALRAAIEEQPNSSLILLRAGVLRQEKLKERTERAAPLKDWRATRKEIPK